MNSFEVEYRSFMLYLVEMVDKIGDLIHNRKKMSHDKLMSKLSTVILDPNHRIHLGVFLVLLSFVIYIVSVQ